MSSAGATECTLATKAAVKALPPSPLHDLEQSTSHDHLHTFHRLKRLCSDILPHMRCRKLPAKGIALVFLGLALFFLILHLPTFNVSIFPCGETSSCFVTKLRSLARSSKLPVIEESEHRAEAPTDLRHIVFCIASTATNWNMRQEYVKLWWQPPEGGTPRRGFVWLDEPLIPANSLTNSSVLPDVRVSGKTSNFLYTWQGGTPSAIRVSQMVSEAFRLGLEDVRWFVMGDDDTVFFPENLAMVLRQYDHRKFFYIGQSSESQKQSAIHSFGMAFGGGGIAISYALMEAMEKMQDKCLSRYPDVYGSDSRIEACVAELGVPLTPVKGFHQIDLRGDISGFLAAHPVAPLVSLHHIDSIEPIFPDKTRVEALRHLVHGAAPDPAGTLQQSVCYDTSRNITVSVSWDYTVQVFPEILTPLEVQKPAFTFLEWRSWQRDPESLKFNVRSLPSDPCKRPIIFFMVNVTRHEDGKTSVGVYRRNRSLEPKNCGRFIEHDVVDIYKHPQSDSWLTAPQRQYCEVMTKNLPFKEPHSLTLQVRDFRQNEIIAPHR